MSKKSKIILICLAVAIVVVAAVIIPIALLKFNKPSKLLTPSKPEIVASENLIVVKTSKIEDAKYYIFEITVPSDPVKVITLESETNILTLDFAGSSSSLKSSFNFAGVYSVQCYAVVQNENSHKSNISTFVRELNLLTPTLTLSGRDFKWEASPNADYYEIVVSSNTNSHSINFDVSQNLTDGIESISISELSSKLNLESGQYSISVRACSNNEYYKSSFYSNSILFFVN